MSTLEEWTATVVAELGIGDLVDADTRDLVLDMTKDVAHEVARPAAPLTAYLMGLAVGRAGSVAEAQVLGRRLGELAVAWGQQHPQAEREEGRGGRRARVDGN
jgi:Domain of unknown function (DUF6457)